MTTNAGPRRVPVALLALAVLAAGCGDADSDPAATSAPVSVSTSSSTTTATTSTVSSPTAVSSPTTVPPTAVPSTTVAPSTVPPTTLTTPPTSVPVPPPTAPVPSSELPGEEFDLTPAPGRVLSVIGVAHDDVLNVRRVPSAAAPIVHRLAPLADDFVATGRARRLTRSIWFEITTSDGVYGWVNSSFTAQAGPTFDITARVVADLGEIPQAATMTELGEMVASVIATDPEFVQRIVQTVPPSFGDLAEVTYDVVGLGDDATAAQRLHIFAVQGGSGFSLRTVEATDMCVPVRGVSSGGLCA